MHGVIVGFVIVLSVAAAAVFGLFIHRDAQLGEILEERARIDLQKAALNAYDAQLSDRLKLVTGASGQPVPEAKVTADLIAVRSKAFDEYMKQKADDFERMLNDADTLNKTNSALYEEGSQTLKKLLGELAERRAEISKEEERFFALQKDNDGKRRELEDKARIAAGEVEQVRKAGRERIAVLDVRIAELDERLRQIKTQRIRSQEVMDPDGAIMQSVSEHGYVVIDRGLRDHIRIGLQFTVFVKRGGQNVEKGSIEVINVDESKATARVVKELRTNDPIIAGDLLHNPVYDPQKIVRFMVAGSFKRYSKQELERFIVDTGAAIGGTMGVDVDYLVAGEEAEDLVNQAVRLGVTIMSEEQMIDFVRPAPTTTIAR